MSINLFELDGGEDERDLPHFNGFSVGVGTHSTLTPISHIRLKNVKLDENLFIEELCKMNTSNITNIELENIHLIEGHFPTTRVFLPSLKKFTFNNPHPIWTQRLPTGLTFNSTMFFFRKFGADAEFNLWDLRVNISIKFPGQVQFEIDHGTKSLTLINFPNSKDILKNFGSRHIERIFVKRYEIDDEDFSILPFIPKSVKSLKLIHFNQKPWDEIELEILSELNELTELITTQNLIKKLPKNLKLLIFFGEPIDVDLNYFQSTNIDTLVCPNLSLKSSKILCAKKIFLFNSRQVVNYELLNSLMENGVTNWIYLEALEDKVLLNSKQICAMELINCNQNRPIPKLPKKNTTEIIFWKSIEGTWKKRDLFMGEKQFYKNKYFSELSINEYENEYPTEYATEHHDEFVTAYFGGRPQRIQNTENTRFKSLKAVDYNLVKILRLNHVSIHVEDMQTIWTAFNHCDHLEMSQVEITHPIHEDSLHELKCDQAFYPRTLHPFVITNLPTHLKTLILEDMDLDLEKFVCPKLKNLTISNCNLTLKFCNFAAYLNAEQIAIMVKGPTGQEFTSLNHDVLMSILTTDAKIILFQGYDFKAESACSSASLKFRQRVGLEGWESDFLLCKSIRDEWIGTYVEGQKRLTLTNSALDGEILVDRMRSDESRVQPNKKNRKRKLITVPTEPPASTTATTFMMSPIVPEIVGHKASHYSIEMTDHVATHLHQYKSMKCTQVLQGSKFLSKIYPTDSGFVQTVVDAYNGHHNLVIRPDDVWTAIAIQFSFFLNANAEEFRGKFVNYFGKKELVVCVPGTLYSAPYDYFVSEMIERIHENIIDEEVKEWFLPSFSTTRPDDVITCGVVLMAAMKKYFDYKCVCSCGIPYVTLEGTVDDWIAIRNKIQKLKTYNLTKWVNMLEPIIHQFIAAKNGNPDVEFWTKVCSLTPHGSGEADLSGWITAFAVFTEKGDWQGQVGKSRQWPKISFDQLPAGSRCYDFGC